MTNWQRPEDEPHARVTAWTGKALDAARQGETREHVLDALEIGCWQHGTDWMDWDADGAFCHVCRHSQLPDDVWSPGDAPDRPGTPEDATGRRETSRDVPALAEYEGGQPRRWLGLSADAWRGVGLLVTVLATAGVTAYLVSWALGWAAPLAALASIGSVAGVLVVIGVVVIWLMRDELAWSEQARKNAIAQMRAEQTEQERRS